MSAKLSSTLAGMALLEFPFLLLVLGPFLGQRFVARLALQDTSSALDERGGHGFEEDSIRCRLNHGFGPVLNVELLAQSKRNYNLAFRREPNGFSFFNHIHRAQYDSYSKVRQ